MSANHKNIFRPDTRLYPQNCSKVPPEEMIRYAGEHVAWSPDGTRILAHGTDQEQVIAELQAAGIHFSEVVWEHVPPLDAEDSLLGAYDFFVEGLPSDHPGQGSADDVPRRMCHEH